MRKKVGRVVNLFKEVKYFLLNTIIEKDGFMHQYYFYECKKMYLTK